MKKSFSDYGIVMPSGAVGDVRTTCPWCSKERKKKGVKCLSVNVEKGCWQCFHCGVSSALGKGIERPQGLHWSKPAYRKPDPRPHLTLPQNAIDWFHSRGITDAVLMRNKIDYGLAYMPQLEADVETVIFPYFRNGELINRKYRTLKEKYFRMDPGCELILYGLDDIDPERVIWVEGEPDKLAFEVAGYQSVVSVPNGAPAPDAKNYNAHFNFLEADHKKIDSVKRHVMALDSDPAGRRLEAELTRRIGIERCFLVRWPEGVKDANEMLLKHGVEELRWYIENAEPFPIEGTFRVSDCREDLIQLYEQGFEEAKSTGWRAVDEFYKVRRGQLTAVTGIPSSGKSEFMDSLLVNLARLHSWRVAVFSPENLPLKQHMAAMAEKYIRKPFHRGRSPRMTRQEVDRAMLWLDEHFTWILPKSEDDWTVERMLAIARQLCLQRGIHGVVIDPWNELEFLRPANLSETEYISLSLKRIRVFARQCVVHVWIVIHPAKLIKDKKGKYPIPTLYDCMGSSHWRNKCDNGIVVWRDLAEADSKEVEIHVQKIRFRIDGRRGTATLFYELASATYFDPSMNGSDNGRRDEAGRNEEFEL